MIQENVYRVTCDVKECKNTAKYVIPQKGRSAKFFICEHCLAELAEDFRKQSVPKSPKNAIKKALDKAKESVREGEIENV